VRVLRVVSSQLLLSVVEFLRYVQPRVGGIVLTWCELLATGEWLRDQNTMEDTITILQKEGWMA
jgi:hypothetical protein